MNGIRRKYYRFRVTSHYGGIVTADTVGCNLSCIYCWNYFKNKHPEKYGKYYSPHEVARILLKLSEESGIRLFRVSGAEPILGALSAKHLVKLVEEIDSPFILETNGIMIGSDERIAEMLVGLPIEVRISVKAHSSPLFEKLTLREGSAFELQIKAVENLSNYSVPYWIAVMDRFVDVEKLRDVLRERGLNPRIELEPLIEYGFVIKNIKKYLGEEYTYETKDSNFSCGNGCSNSSPCSLKAFLCSFPNPNTFIERG